MFGSYDIIETVGQGGMGIVYRAMDVSLDREVAVKVLKEDLRTHPQVVARFQREAEAFASLNHPNIVHIYSVGAVGKIPFIAMEFIRGEPLSDIMKRERRMDWKRALFLGEQVAKALSTAHESQIIHRDIKPGNILVTKDDHAFVTDFGIAKVLTAETQLTVEGSRLGTPQYMSPERCRNEEAMASSDLYSLGVLVFQMISGRLPYEGVNPVDLVHKIVSQPAKRLSDFMPDVPQDVERLVAYLIEKDPRDRPASGNEWAELSERVREGKPLFEDTDGMSESLRNFRESIPTPTPMAAAGDFARAEKGLAGHLAKRWRRLGAWGRWGLASIPIVLVSLWAGFLYDAVAHRDFAFEAVAGLRDDMSLWERNLDAVSFVQEAPGVQLIQIHMPGYKAAPSRWIDRDTALIMLTGSADSEGVSLRGIGHISLEAHDMELASPPKMLAGLSVLGMDENGRALLARQAYPEGLAELFTVDPQSMPYESGVAGDAVYGLGAERPRLVAIREATWSQRRSSWLVVGAEDATGEGWGVWEYRKNVAQPALLYSSDEALRSIVSSPSGIYFVRGDELGAGTLLRWSPDEDSPARLVSGVGVLDEASLEPDGDRMAVPLATTGSGESELHMVDADTGEQLNLLGSGSYAAWHPSGAYLIALAADRKGQQQVWAIESESPNSRVQLTYLNDGVSGTLQIAPDGRFAVAGRNSTEEPGLVLVDVSAEALGDLGLLVTSGSR
jgi:predicted Ser/Thr protein kinase